MTLSGFHNQGCTNSTRRVTMRRSSAPSGELPHARPPGPRREHSEFHETQPVGERFCAPDSGEARERPPSIQIHAAHLTNLRIRSDMALWPSSATVPADRRERAPKNGSKYSVQAASSSSLIMHPVVSLAAPRREQIGAPTSFPRRRLGTGPPVAYQMGHPP